jgi:hypothetical protein
MIVHRCKQGSEEWSALHVGRPSASRFSDIITAKTRKPSASAERYAIELCVGYFLGPAADSGASGFMARGLQLESEARAYYELVRDAAVEQVGFVTPDHGRWGCSPDGLVGTDGLLEIKTLSAKEHIAAALGLADEYTLQIAGQLWVCERKWCERMYYSPCFPPIIQRVERDESLIEQLADAVEAFCGRLDAMKENLIVLGYAPYVVPTKRAADADDAEFDRLVGEMAETINA